MFTAVSCLTEVIVPTDTGSVLSLLVGLQDGQKDQAAM